MKYNQVISDRYSKEKKDMKIIKRNGSEEAFDVKKIEAAVRKADGPTNRAPFGSFAPICVYLAGL